MASRFSTRTIFGIVLAVAIIGAGVFFFRTKATTPAAAFSLPVPFTSQAPTGNWEGNEDCEEASAVMVNAFFGGTNGGLPAQTVQDEIAKLNAWEKSNLGYNINTGAADTGRMIEGVYDLKTKILDNFSEETLKTELQGHHLIILPVNASVLDPKGYPGTRLYHVIVIRGYDSRGFIVHDPGTEAGADNIYSFAALEKAAGDWDKSAEKISADKKPALIVFL